MKRKKQQESQRMENQHDHEQHQQRMLLKHHPMKGFSYNIHKN